MAEIKKTLPSPIHAVILAGSVDFGRCPLASRLPAAVWPIAGVPALTRVVRKLSLEGITKVTICFNGDKKQLQDILTDVGQIEIEFLEEDIPLGTAGCLRDTAVDNKETQYLVCPAAINDVPNLENIVREHNESDAEMTVLLNPQGENNRGEGEITGIYLFESSVLDSIPPEGYVDIKETLIPSLVQARRRVHGFRLSRSVGSFRDRNGYLNVIADHLENGLIRESGIAPGKVYAEDVRISESAKVHPGARIYGPVIILEQAVVGENAIILGPAIVGKNVHIGEGTFVEGSVLWDRARIGRDCKLQRGLLDYDVDVPDISTVVDQVVPFRKYGFLGNLLPRMGAYLMRLKEQIGFAEPRVVWWLLAVLVLLLTFIWSFSPTLKVLWGIWMRSDEYSSGLLVPFLAAYIIWSRRKNILNYPINPAWGGIVIFIALQWFRLHFGLYLNFGSAERLSMVLSISALVIMVLGWRFFFKIWGICFFLLLMIPLPNRVQAAITLPLQKWSTISSVFCLESFGYDAIREGNLIHIGDTSVAVAEACNGLRMITAFFVISGLVILLVKRTWWEKFIILLSSLPIALLCNTVRLTVTAIAFTIITAEEWEQAFHDYGGLAMMPLALGTVVLELWFLSKMFIVTEAPDSEGLLVRKTVKKT